MDLLLTDRLTCPRCGPEFGLILLADRLEDRRVLEGALGCPNCRDRYPVIDGFGDLRPPPRTAFPEEEPLPAPDSPTLMEVAGLLGITAGVGHVALLGALAGHADALGEKLQPVEVIMQPAFPFVDVSTPVELLSTMITPENPAVLVRDFKTEKTFIITRTDIIRVLM